MMTVAVFGASGFLGQAVVAHLNQLEGCSARAIVHSSGNAWALVSAGVPIHFADLAEPGSIREALSGCTHVVNCSRGSKNLMIQGLDNLLNACREADIQRFVHISSVAIFGSQATLATISEDAQENPDTDYGVIKQTQDRQVTKARDQGLESVILCPPNIGGAGSPFVDEVYGSLMQKRFAYVNEGGEPLELVDVHNLAYAVGLALSAPLPERVRYFITDGADATWADLVAHIERGFDRRFNIPNIEKDRLIGLSAPADSKRPSVKGAMKHVVSSEVRAAMRLNPLWEKFDKWIRGRVAKLPWSLEDSFRLSIEGTMPVTRVDPLSGIDKRLCEQQMKGVRYACTNAQRDLGYQPPYSLAASVEAFARWRGAGSNILDDYRDLLVELES